MKIVDAKPPKSMADEFREIAKEIIADSNKAAFFDLFPEVHQFGKILKSMGYKASWRKQKSGWLVWARK